MWFPRTNLSKIYSLKISLLNSFATISCTFIQMTETSCQDLLPFESCFLKGGSFAGAPLKRHVLGVTASTMAACAV